MTFWQRVTIQDSTVTLTATGNPRLDWEDVDGLTDREARLLPLVVAESKMAWATPEEDAYECQLRGPATGVRPRMRVVIGDAAYDIRGIIEPPPFGDPVTVLHVVLVTP